MINHHGTTRYLFLASTAFTISSAPTLKYCNARDWSSRELAYCWVQCYQRRRPQILSADYFSVYFLFGIRMPNEMKCIDWSEEENSTVQRKGQLHSLTSWKIETNKKTTLRENDEEFRCLSVRQLGILLNACAQSRKFNKIAGFQ